MQLVCRLSMLHFPGGPNSGRSPTICRLSCLISSPQGQAAVRCPPTHTWKKLRGWPEAGSHSPLSAAKRRRPGDTSTPSLPSSTCKGKHEWAGVRGGR